MDLLKSDGEQYRPEPYSIVTYIRIHKSRFKILYHRNTQGQLHASEAVV